MATIAIDSRSKSNSNESRAPAETEHDEHLYYTSSSDDEEEEEEELVNVFKLNFFIGKIYDVPLAAGEWRSYELLWYQKIYVYITDQNSRFVICWPKN
jgi:hypothetical protein